MTIDQAHIHPQAEAFRDGAATMRGFRYHRSDVIEEQIDILNALKEVATELAYHLDQHRVLETEAMEANRAASRIPLPAFVPSNAAMILLPPLAATIENLGALRDI